MKEEEKNDTREKEQERVKEIMISRKKEDESRDFMKIEIDLLICL